MPLEISNIEHKQNDLTKTFVDMSLSVEDATRNMIAFSDEIKAQRNRWTTVAWTILNIQQWIKDRIYING